MSAGRLAPPLATFARGTRLIPGAHQLGSAYEHGAGEPGIPALYFLTARTGSSTSLVQLPVLQDQTTALGSNATYLEAVSVEEATAQRFGGREGFRLNGRLELELAGNYYTSAWGRGCLNGAAGFGGAGTTGCEYNGARWFDGPSPQRNETESDPQAAHPPGSASPGPMLELNNAGALSGVATIQMPLAYETAEASYRVIEGVLGGAQRAADFNLFWVPTAGSTRWWTSPTTSRCRSTAFAWRAPGAC